MRLAVLADVHANWPALRSVLAAAKRRGVEGFVCLGDLVGYYADPVPCVDALCELGASCLRGNHDASLLGHDIPLMRGGVRETHVFAERALGDERLARLRTMPHERWFEWGSAVHGCWINPARVSGYVTVTTAAMNLAWLCERVSGAHVGLFGHTHVPMLHHCDGRDVRLAEGQRVQLPRHEPVLVNPGSVGQPRDGDPRASFALFDVDRLELELVRVAYPIDETVRRLREAGFDESFAMRLYAGE